MGQNTEPFTPVYQGTGTRTVSGSSATIALAKTGAPQTVMVSSLAGNAIAFIEFGDSTIAAAIASGCPILPGAVMIFSVAAAVTHMAAIGTAGTLYVTSGHGS